MGGSPRVKPLGQNRKRKGGEHYLAKELKRSYAAELNNTH